MNPKDVLQGKTIAERDLAVRGKKPHRSVRSMLLKALRDLRRLREEVAELKNPKLRDPVDKACRKLGVSREELIELGRLAQQPPLTATVTFEPQRPTRVRRDYHGPGAPR